jgi:hypothetical protein
VQSAFVFPGRLMPDDPNTRTEEDLARAVRALAREFKADTVVIVGSQAILMSWPDAPGAMRYTPEIDAYPGNAREWEREETDKGDGSSPEASEHIHALFGLGSPFHEAHGFYIDGVDEFTAKLPHSWRARATVKRLVVDGREVTVVAPEPNDLVVSKLARLDDKDKDFIEAYHRARTLDTHLIEQRIAETDLDPAIAGRAIAYIRNLTGRSAI